jgi:hypothetical protein
MFGNRERLFVRWWCYDDAIAAYRTSLRRALRDQILYCSFGGYFANIGLRKSATSSAQ